jgi:thiamine-phosphate pyrophosphorylase
MLARPAWQTLAVDERRRRLASARLYLVCDERDDRFLAAALDGGVQIVQLRVKDRADDELLDCARRFARRCREAGALLIINDRPALALAADADGVHLGQEDMPVNRARAIVGPQRLVGLSTHSAAQIADAAGVDYIGVGPVYATPTKPGRPAVGLELVRHAAAHARTAFFAIGGIGPDNVAEVIRAGARRIAVVRAIADAEDPGQAARRLRGALDRAWAAEEERVGAAQP